VQRVVRRKGIVDSLKKFVSNVGDDIGIVWGMEPYYISAPRSFRFGWLGILIKLVVVTAFL
jgi:hypothetical protein